MMSCTSFRVNLHSIVGLNVKEPLAWSRRHIWSLSDSNEIQTHTHLVCKWNVCLFTNQVVVGSNLVERKSVCFFCFVLSLMRLYWRHCLFSCINEINFNFSSVQKIKNKCFCYTWKWICNTSSLVSLENIYTNNVIMNIQQNKIN